MQTHSLEILMDKKSRTPAMPKMKESTFSHLVLSLAYAATWVWLGFMFLFPREPCQQCTACPPAQPLNCPVVSYTRPPPRVLHILSAQGCETENYHGFLGCRPEDLLRVEIENEFDDCDPLITVGGEECHTVRRTINTETWRSLVFHCKMPRLPPGAPYTVMATCGAAIHFRRAWYSDCQIPSGKQVLDRPILQCPTFSGGASDRRDISPFTAQRFDFNVGLPDALQVLGPGFLAFKINFLTSSLYSGWGPGKQTSNVLSGFRQIGSRFEVNSQKYDEFNANVVLDLGRGETPPWRDVFFDREDAGNFWITVLVDSNASIFQSPHDAKWCSRRLVPSCKFAPCPNQPVAPIGVDVDFFAPVQDIRQRKSILLYIKEEGKKFANDVANIIQSKSNLTIIPIVYGDSSYNDHTFRLALQKARFAVVLDLAETYGIAMQEIKAADVPVIYIDVEAVNFWHPQFGMIVKDLAAFEKHFSSFARDVLDMQYSPRAYVRNVLSLAAAATNMMQIFTTGKGWWRNENRFCDGPLADQVVVYG
jgi:hypothetical protein